MNKDSANTGKTTTGAEVDNIVLTEGKSPSIDQKSSLNNSKKPMTEMKVDGEIVTLYNDEHFSTVRTKIFNISSAENLLKDFKFEQLTHGGGKGGSPLAFLPSGYIVKEINSGDNESLLEMTEALCKRALGKNTFIVTFLAHFKTKRSGRNYAAMSNAFHVHGVSKDAKVFWKYMFDLKGCRDDRMMRFNNQKVPEIHKRFWMFYNCWYCCDLFECQNCSCCDLKERGVYYQGKVEAYQGKLQLTKTQKHVFAQRLKGDAEFLNSFGVMDYSLLVGVQSYKSIEEAKKAGIWPRAASGGNGDSDDQGSQFVCRIKDQETGDILYLAFFFGIVDFFQKWNAAKIIARTVKLCCFCCAPKPLSTVQPDRYSVQFTDHITRKFLPTGWEIDPHDNDDDAASIIIKGGGGGGEEKNKSKKASGGSSQQESKSIHSSGDRKETNEKKMTTNEAGEPTNSNVNDDVSLPPQNPSDSAKETTDGADAKCKDVKEGKQVEQKQDENIITNPPEAITSAS